MDDKKSLRDKPATILTGWTDFRGEIKRWIMVVSICIGLWITPGVVNAAAWPLYQANTSHNGYIPISCDPVTFSLKWTQTLGTGDLHPVTASQNYVFVSDSRNLYVLDAETGTVKWSKNYPGVFSVGHPSFADGTVYVQTCNHGSDTYLHAYEADTGTVVFDSPHSAQWEQYYAPTLYEGIVYVNGGYYGGIYAFDATAGTELWFQSLNQYDEWTPAVDQNYAYAYVGEYSPGLYVFDRFDGSPQFNIPDPDFDWDGWSMRLAPVLGGSDDILAIHDGRLISFDLDGRTIGWQMAENFSGQPSVDKNVIYAVNTGRLDARNQTTGSLIWFWEHLTDTLLGTLIVTDTHVFARSDSTLYAIDISTHKDVWSYKASGHMAVSEGTLFIAGKAGVMTAIDMNINITVSLYSGKSIKCTIVVLFMFLLTAYTTMRVSEKNC